MCLALSVKPASSSKRRIHNFDWGSLNLNLEGADLLSASQDHSLMAFQYRSGAMSITNLVKSCFDAYNNLLDVLKSSEEHDANEPYTSRVLDQRGRFRVWAGNTGAFRYSLDIRLQDASHIRTRVVKLLADMLEALEDATEIITLQREPWEKMEDSQSMASSETGQSTSELQSLMSDLIEINDCLLRISVTARDPAPHDQYVAFNDPDATALEAWDLFHIQIRFPLADEGVAKQLAKAMSYRRQCLEYRRDQHNSLKSKADADAVNAERMAFHELRESIMVSPPGQQATDHSDLDDDSNAYKVTLSSNRQPSSSLFDSVRGHVRERYWPTWPDSASGKPVECLLCYRMVVARSSKEWIRHISEDLQPYVCISKDCKSYGKTFAQYWQWMNHASRNHNREWHCLGCEQVFTARSEYTSHLKWAHLQTFNEEGVQAIAHASERSAADDKSNQCPLCLEHFTSQIIAQQHIAQHQADLALYALPERPGSENKQDTKEAKEGLKEATVEPWDHNIVTAVRTSQMSTSLEKKPAPPWWEEDVFLQPMHESTPETFASHRSKAEAERFGGTCEPELVERSSVPVERLSHQISTPVPTPVKPETTSFSESSILRGSQPSISWRLRLGDKFWDFENERPVRSNTTLIPSQVREERDVFTDIGNKFVSERALENANYRYERLKVDTSSGRYAETIFSIRRALTYSEVAALVLFTQDDYERRFKRPRPSTYLHTRQQRHSALPPDLSYSSKSPPSPKDGLDNHDDTLCSSQSSSDDYESDTNTDYYSERRSSSSSRSMRRASSRGNSGRTLSSGTKRSKGREASSVVAGAGIAALLEGVVEGLGSLNEPQNRLPRIDEDQS